MRQFILGLTIFTSVSSYGADFMRCGSSFFGQDGLAQKVEVMEKQVAGATSCPARISLMSNNRVKVILMLVSEGITPTGIDQQYHQCNFRNDVYSYPKGDTIVCAGPLEHTQYPFQYIDRKDWNYWFDNNETIKNRL